MFIYLGRYKSWVGSYQIANSLKKIGVSDERCDKFGDWLSETWFHKFLEWIHSKKKRVEIVKIHPRDTWNMDHTLSLIILPMLKQLKVTKHGAPHVEDSDVPEELRSTSAPKPDKYDIDEFHFNRFDYVLDEMIWTFEQLTEDDNDGQFYTGVVDLVFVENPETGRSTMEHGENHTSTFDKEGYNKHQERITNGLRLFGLYFRGLWD